jgi:thymidylate synthase
MTIDERYKQLVKDIFANGNRVFNERTKKSTLQRIGLYWDFDMADGFPLLSLKKTNWRMAFAEQLGFLRGYSSAASFRAIGVNVWDANANANEDWLRNPNRDGHDDLGAIYGVQGRWWGGHYDQVRKVYEHLRQGVDDRREIVTYWNPSELDKMALPPCHFVHVYSLTKETLDLTVVVRSNDVGLGLPFNVAQYAWLLHVMAQITGHLPGKLHYHAINVHIYEDHTDGLLEAVSRRSRPQPKLLLDPRCDCLEWLEMTDSPVEHWTNVIGYNPHPFILLPMAV